MLHLNPENILKSSSLAVTKSRLKILKFFLNKNKPISLKSIRLVFNDFDRVTLFRILSVFEKSKLIHVINLDNGNKLYALCNHECNESPRHVHDHVHFICEKCDDVTCLYLDKFPKLSAPNYIFNNIDINVSGVCSNCN